LAGSRHGSAGAALRSCVSTLDLEKFSALGGGAGIGASRSFAKWIGARSGRTAAMRAAAYARAAIVLIAAAISAPLCAEYLATIKDLKEGTRSFSYLFSREQMSALYGVGVLW